MNGSDSVIRDPQRLLAVEAFGAVDTESETEFDDLTRLAALVCDSKTALITLVLEDRQWLKSRLGFDAPAPGLKDSFCKFALSESEIFIVEDTHLDDRFSSNPLVVGEPHVRFYAGAVLRTADGFAIGTICVLDDRARSLTQAQQNALVSLARQVVSLLELRARNREREQFLGVSGGVFFTIDHAGRVTSTAPLGGAKEPFGTPFHAPQIALPEELVGFVENGIKHGVARNQVVHVAPSRWLHVAMNPTSAGFAVHYRDVTPENHTENTFANLVNSLPMVTWVSDHHRIAPFINDPWFEYVGRSRGDEEALVWSNFLHPDDLEETLERWHRSNQEVSAFRAEARVRRHDGEYRWFRLESIPRKHQGDIVWFGSAIDIHETVSLRVEALRSVRRFQRTINSMRDGFFTLDTNNRCTIANERFLSFLELSRDDLHSVDVLDAFPDSARATVARLLERAAETQTEQTSIIRFFEQDREFSLRIYPVKDEFTVCLTDITEQARAERDRSQVAERFRLLAQASTELIWELDMTTGEIWVSSAPEDVFGEVFMPKTNDASGWMDLAHPDDRPELDRSFNEAVAQRRPIWSITYRVPAEDEMRHFRSKAALVYDVEGQPLKAIGSTADVTDEVRMEQHVLRAQRTETVGRIAGGIAHDLNNVLAPILVTASLVKELVEDPELRDDLELIESSARRGSRMISRLLAFARGSGSKVELIDSREVILDVLTLLRETVPRNIEFKTSLEPGLYVEGEETEIHQVLTNLVVNARDSMPDGGTLTISTHSRDVETALPAGPFVVIDVSDTGSGIPKEQIEAIFDPYFTTKEMGKGTGLGLPISQRILESHDGFMFVDSKVGGGTTFTVFLPLALAEQDLTESSASAVEEHVEQSNIGTRVLVVDDERAILRAAERLLAVAGYEVHTASDGREGLRAFQDLSPFDLVITDVMMPLMSGDEMAREIKKAGRNTPILAWSGRVEPRTREVLEPYIDGFLDKPFSSEQLLSQVGRLLSESDTPSTPRD